MSPAPPASTSTMPVPCPMPTGRVCCARRPPPGRRCATGAAVEEGALESIVGGQRPRSVIWLAGAVRRRRPGGTIGILGATAGEPWCPRRGVPPWIGPLTCWWSPVTIRLDPALVSAVAVAVRRGARVVVVAPFEGPLREAGGPAAVLAPRLYSPEDFGLTRYLAAGLATLAAVDPAITTDLPVLADELTPRRCATAPPGRCSPIQPRRWPSGSQAVRWCWPATARPPWGWPGTARRCCCGSPATPSRPPAWPTRWWAAQGAAGFTDPVEGAVPRRADRRPDAGPPEGGGPDPGRRTCGADRPDRGHRRCGPDGRRRRRRRCGATGREQCRTAVGHLGGAAGDGRRIPETGGDSTAVQLLHGAIRTYAWGSRTAIAGVHRPPGPTAHPEAELWLGAHPATRRCWWTPPARRRCWTSSPPTPTENWGRRCGTGSATRCRSWSRCSPPTSRCRCRLTRAPSRRWRAMPARTVAGAGQLPGAQLPGPQPQTRVTGGARRVRGAGRFPSRRAVGGTDARARRARTRALYRAARRPARCRRAACLVHHLDHRPATRYRRPHRRGPGGAVATCAPGSGSSPPRPAPSWNSASGILVTPAYWPRCCSTGSTCSLARASSCPPATFTATFAGWAWR